MKKIIFLSALFILFSTNFCSAQDDQTKKTEYCILRVYSGGIQGVLIVYEDLTVEKHALLGTKLDEVLQTTMVYINQIKTKGFVLVASTTKESGGLNEYIFKKE